MRADSFNMGTNRWFTSDLHFGHANIIGFCDRPFNDVHHMNVAICENINNAVTPEDELWILGDLAMGNVDKTIPIVHRLTAGRTILVPGNHDRLHPMHNKVNQWRPVYEKAGLVVTEPTTAITLANGVEVKVSHFPYKGDSREMDRFEQWRPADTGGWLLSGHVHEKWRQRGRAINVGIDAWGGVPVSETQIIELIDAGPADRDIIKWERKGHGK
jgi:calcineurin-like phosphoesterase family protein